MMGFKRHVHICWLSFHRVMMASISSLCWDFSSFTCRLIVLIRYANIIPINTDHIVPHPFSHTFWIKCSFSLSWYHQFVLAMPMYYCTQTTLLGHSCPLKAGVDCFGVGCLCVWRAEFLPNIIYDIVVFLPSLASFLGFISWSANLAMVMKPLFSSFFFPSHNRKLGTSTGIYLVGSGQMYASK